MSNSSPLTDMNWSQAAIQRCSYKTIFKNMLEIYRRTPMSKWISIKLLCNFIEITLRHGCSPVNLQHIFRTPFPKNTSGRLPLADSTWLFNSWMIFDLVLLDLEKLWEVISSSNLKLAKTSEKNREIHKKNTSDKDNFLVNLHAQNCNFGAWILIENLLFFRFSILILQISYVKLISIPCRL